jgi:hypothetical protein
VGWRWRHGPGRRRRLGGLGHTHGVGTGWDGQSSRANLLARNLDLPLEEDAAVDIAFAEHTRTIDLIKLIVDDRPPEHFAVIAGIGVDAMIIDETDPDLKDKIGSAACFLAAAKALGRSPIRLTVQLAAVGGALVLAAGYDVSDRGFTTVT